MHMCITIYTDQHVYVGYIATIAEHMVIINHSGTVHANHACMHADNISKITVQTSMQGSIMYIHVNHVITYADFKLVCNIYLSSS